MDGAGCRAGGFGLRLTSLDTRENLDRPFLPGLRRTRSSLFSAHNQIIPGFSQRAASFRLAEILHLQLVASSPKGKSGDGPKSRILHARLWKKMWITGGNHPENIEVLLLPTRPYF